MRTEIWEGFIFVNISGDAEPLHPPVDGFTENTGKLVAKLQAWFRRYKTPFIMINARTGKSIQPSFL